MDDACNWTALVAPLQGLAPRALLTQGGASLALGCYVQAPSGQNSRSLQRVRPATPHVPGTSIAKLSGPAATRHFAPTINAELVPGPGNGRME